MSVNSPEKMTRALEGIHEVRVIRHSAYIAEFDRLTPHPSGFESNNLMFVQRIWRQRPPCLKPLECSINGDSTVIERIANVLTSLPFIALGLQAPRNSLNSTLYANSLIGVGIASSLYHSSTGNLRKFLKWADYTTIAAASICLSRALSKENQKVVTVASALCLPIQPLMVSAIHTGMMQMALSRRAYEDPELKKAHKVHKMSTMVGGVLFFADDVFPGTPFLHAAWHLAAALVVKTLNDLLK